LSVQHLVFRADDIFAAAKVLKANGFVPLQISPNYYDDSEARASPQKKLYPAAGHAKNPLVSSPDTCGRNKCSDVS
jgi:hypothetical protein